MTRKKTSIVTAGIILVVLLIGTAITLKLKSGPGGNGSDNSLSPLGGLFQTASDVSKVKEQVGALRPVYFSFVNYAKEHQDDLPKTVADLRPYLPSQLASLDDEHWELPSTGKTTPLLNAPNAKDQILLQQKDTPPGKAKIIVFADGHIEYKR